MVAHYNHSVHETSTALALSHVFYTLTKFQLNPTLHLVSASTYTVERDYMKPKPTQTGDTLNSKLQLKWAPDIIERTKSLFQRAFTLLLSWNTNPFLLCPLQALRAFALK